MAESMTIMPTLTAARLVASHVDILWSTWHNEREPCCQSCCAACAALKDLMDRGQLDRLYSVYLESTGGMSTLGWDEKNHQVGREWLSQAMLESCDGCAVSGR